MPRIAFSWRDSFWPWLSDLISSLVNRLSTSFECDGGGDISETLIHGQPTAAMRRSICETFCSGVDAGLSASHGAA